MARIGELFAAIWQWGLGWLFCLIFVPIMVTATLLVRTDRDRVLSPLIRLWGRALLWLCWVRVRVDQPEAMVGPGRRVLVINHTSTLDLLLACAYWPQRGAGVLKQEFRSIPVLGWAAEVLGHVFVDRSSTEQAKASMAEAADKMRRDDRAVILAPEGTRSVTGELGRFKLGAWHLAAAADAPLIPLVIHGAHQVWPRKRWSSRGGTIAIQVLPAIYPAAMQPADFRASAASLRDRYVEELGKRR